MEIKTVSDCQCAKSYIHAFLATLQGQPVEAQVRSVAIAIEGGEGSWNVPKPHEMPSGCLIEISLFETTAFGTSPTEAVRNWIRVASKKTYGPQS